MGRRKVEPVEKAAKAKERYRVTNWAEYNRALINRGSLTIWLADEVVAAQHTCRLRGPPTHGAQLVGDVVQYEDRVGLLTGHTAHNARLTTALC